MFEIEDIQDLSGFERAARVRNAFFPLNPISGDQLKAFSLGQLKDVPKRIVLLKQGREDVATVRVVQQFWTPEPDLYSSSISYLRHSDATRLAREVVPISETLATELGAKRITTWAMGTTPELADVLIEQGYESGQRNPVTMADLSQFDPEPYQPVIARAEADGYTFLDGHDLKARFPEDALRRMYRYDMDAMADVPLPEPFEEIPFELYLHDLEAPGQDLALRIYALKDDEIAAGTGLIRNLVDTSIASTGLTGTLRAHRRKGLATAVKVICMERAHRLGIRSVITDNEENNPMLALNTALGFRQVTEMTEYRKTLG